MRNLSILEKIYNPGWATHGYPWADFLVKPMGWDGPLLKKRPWVGWAKTRKTHGSIFLGPAQPIRTSVNDLLLNKKK
jgi:hypothetical protein